MLRKEKNAFLFVFSFLLIVGLFWGQTTTVKAYYDSDAMKYTPSGLELNNLINPTSSLFVNGKNNGKYVPTIISDNNGNYSILKLNGSTADSVTSVWSNLDADNYIDVTKKQDLSFWIYLGDSSTNVDGMAFVLQNDSRGTDAISSDGSGIVGGQTLGVWGINSNTNKTADSIANSAIKNSWALEFDDHRDGNDSSGKTETMGSSYDTYDLDANRSMGEQHTGWNYPGLASSYKPIPSTNGIFQLVHNNPETLFLNGLGHPQWGWHHVMINYTPPETKGGIAKLDYSFNTKSADKHENNLSTYETTGQNLIYHSVDLDTSQFHLDDSNKLRFGFTSSEGNMKPGSMWVVFESIPSIVQAQSTAYVVDDTSKSRVDTDTGDANPSYVEDEDKALPITTEAHPGDDLKFKYGIKYEGGKQAATDIKSTLNIPSNVTFNSDVIGKVTYVSDDGTKTEHVDLTKANNVSTDGSTLTYNVETLDNAKGADWTAVKIELDGTASDIPSGSTSLKVPFSHVNFTGTNYKSDAQTDAFKIVEPEATLDITKDAPDPQDIFQTGTANLNGHLTFKKGGTVTPITNSEDYDLHYSINGGADVLGHATSDDASKFSIPIDGSELKVGENDITVQAVYTNYKSSSGAIETVGSKKIHYTVNVNETGLVATATNTDKITTLNDKLVPLPTITLKHNDGSGLEDGNDQVDYTISNPNKNNGQPISFSDTPYPSLSEGTGGGNRQYNLSISNSDGLSVGENTVTVKFTDPGKHVSNVLTFVIDVEDTKPVLTYGDKNNGEMTVVASEDGDITFPMNIAYENGEQFKPSDMKFTAKVDTNSPIAVDSIKSNTPQSTYYFERALTRKDLGIDANDTSDKHTVTFTATDPYGRTSELTFTLKMLYSTASLTYKDSYSFGSLNQSQGSRLVKRTSDWDVVVNTVDSKYKLTASADPLTTGGSNDTHTLSGGLIYVDPKTGISQSMTAPVTLSENDSETTYKYPISDSWSADSGILLKVDSNPFAGSYSGGLNWDLTDSI
ncbi:hypothetical protein [Companilactobacillus muriivasis]|uniref:hypothetical protein n=1 Tax=Companilactobacillus muriivasis TaxID=3081444 RepID=UPI0030C65BE5